MKLKKAHFRIEPLETTSERWASLIKSPPKPVRRTSGSVTNKNNDEWITLSDWDVLGKVLSPPRLQILSAIPGLKPKSISALAKALKKDFKNVYNDVFFLAELGLIELKEEGTRKTLVPIAKYNGIELDWVA